MAVSGRIRRRLALAIVATALIPVLVAVLLAESMVRQASARFYVPEIGDRLDQSLSLYQELARAIKTGMRHEANAIASHEPLRRAAAQGSKEAARAELQQLFSKYPNLVRLAVTAPGGATLAEVERTRPVDPARENTLHVVVPLDGTRGPARSPEEEEDERLADDELDEEAVAGGPQLSAVFAADRSRFDELEQMSQFVDTYKQIERRREQDTASYIYAFAALLGITIVAAVGVGALLARGISSRLGQLASATGRVGAGDLNVRVPERGSDEIADFSRAFNRMVAEIETSRARIEYLQRIGAWQEMARRLAHEIKNPLTPIQLAVQEAHRRCPSGDAEYKRLLDTTLEIVQDEVGTLRRLVSEFSSFARLPQAQLSPGDLREFLLEQQARLLLLDDDEPEATPAPDPSSSGIEIELAVADAPAPANLDRQMLRRALINLVRNAAQAITHAGRQRGRIRVALRRAGDYHLIEIEDDGPGIPPELEQAIFDPYVTTKPDGAGLGLAIVKKIVVEHGGSITAGSSSLGGATIRVRIPAAGTPPATAALQAHETSPPSSSMRAPRAT